MIECRTWVLDPKVKHSTNERVFPLVADFNPGLPYIVFGQITL